MITQEQLDRLLEEADKLHQRRVLAGQIGPDWFEPGMMEYLDQSDGTYDSITGSLILRFEARGTRYDGRTEQIEKVQVGDEIRVFRDAENPFNPNNFTMTTAKGKNVGHMPAELCNAIAPLYDERALHFVYARASFVDPISKRNRHAKQGVLFVELCCSITGESRLIAEQILSSRNTTDTTPLESTAGTDQTDKTNPNESTLESERALEPALRKLLAGKHLEPLRTALADEGILSLDSYLKINLYGFIYSRKVYPPTRCKAIVASLRAKTQKVKSERIQQEQSQTEESTLRPLVTTEKETQREIEVTTDQSENSVSESGRISAFEQAQKYEEKIQRRELEIQTDHNGIEPGIYIQSVLDFIEGMPASLSQKTYLKCIAKLSTTKSYIRQIDIAEALGISKPSVSVAIKQLKALGWITDNDRCIRLNEAVFGGLPRSGLHEPQLSEPLRSNEAKTKPIAYMGQGKFLFVSYSHKDADVVYPLIQEMADQGLPIWYDEGLEPGSGWDDNVAIHIERCELVIAMISHKYLSSDNCKDELNYARDIGKKTILVYTEKTELPAGMRLRFNRLFALFQYELSREDFYRKLFSVKEIGFIKGHE